MIFFVGFQFLISTTKEKDLLTSFSIDWLMFYGISTLVSYLMPNPVYKCTHTHTHTHTYIYIYKTSNKY